MNFAQAVHEWGNLPGARSDIYDRQCKDCKTEFAWTREVGNILQHRCPHCWQNPKMLKKHLKEKIV